MNVKFWGLQDTTENIFWDLLGGPGECFLENFESGTSQIGTCILGQILGIFSQPHTKISCELYTV